MKKIGIMTFYNSYNYGALLQAYATQKFLENNDNEAIFLNYSNEYEHKFNKLFSYRKNLSLKSNMKILIKNLFFGRFILASKKFQIIYKEFKKE